MENKHPIDSTNFSQSSFKKLKKFINARNDEEVIDFHLLDQYLKMV